MTNPGNAVGTNGGYGGRTSVNAFNDVLASFGGRGILSGWTCSPKIGMTIQLGGNGTTRDVAIAEDDMGNRTTIDNISAVPIDLTLENAPTLGSRIDTIVAYVNNPPENIDNLVDNPSCCGLIAVASAVSTEPVAASEEQIRDAITADGASGVTAYYVVLARISVAEGATDIVGDNIEDGDQIEQPSMEEIDANFVTKQEFYAEVGGVNANLIRLDTGEGVQL